jgi:hypothetical protein
MVKLILISDYMVNSTYSSGENEKVYCANSSKSFKNIFKRLIMPEFRQFYDDEIQGQSLIQGHSIDSVGISTSIRLLFLNNVSIGDTVVKKCGGHFFMCLV